MEPEESLVSPSVAGTDSEMLGECEIDITDELGRRKAPVHGAGKEGKQRMRKWFVDTVFDGVLVYKTQRNIEILLSDDKHTEMTFGRGGVLMQEQFAQLVLNKSCLGWEKSDEVYLCLERDAKKTTHRTSGNLLACISTGVWQEKIKHANTNIQPVPGSGIDVASIRGEDVMPMPPPAKRAKSEASEAASKEENERFHVIALIRHEKTNKSERVFLVNDQDRIFNTLYKEPDVDAYMTAADKWASTFGTAQFSQALEAQMWGQKPPLVKDDSDFLRNSKVISRIMWCSLSVGLKLYAPKGGKFRNAIQWLQGHTPKPFFKEPTRQVIPTEIPKVHLGEPVLKTSFKDFF